MYSILLAAAEGGILTELAGTAQEVGEAFGFKWQLFLSQMVSFAIVAVLLQVFAFKPIINVLEERRKKIQQSLDNAEEIKRQLADAEAKYREILAKASADAQAMVDEAKKSADALAGRRTQQAIAEAEGIIARAREATDLERERILADVRKELGRLVVDTTAKVAGKVLTPEDQKRLSEEAARQIAA